MRRSAFGSFIGVTRAHDCARGGSCGARCRRTISLERPEDSRGRICRSTMPWLIAALNPVLLLAAFGRAVLGWPIPPRIVLSVPRFRICSGCSAALCLSRRPAIARTLELLPTVEKRRRLPLVDVPGGRQYCLAGRPCLQPSADRRDDAAARSFGGAPMVRTSWHFASRQQ